MPKSLPKRPWHEPPPEVPLTSPTTRKLARWTEPPGEVKITQPLRSHRPFKPLRPTSKSKATRPDHCIHPQLHNKISDYGGICHFPRFKRIQHQKPIQSHEKALMLKKKNADTWIMVLAHLHRFSLLFQKTMDNRYQDEHVANVLSNYSQISIARHLQVWQHFTEWCEPFGFHPANISTSFLLDFIYEATFNIRKQIYSMKTLIQSLKFVAHHAEAPKLSEILNTPVIQGYVLSTKKPQNPREVFPLPFHLATSFEHYGLDVRRPPLSRLIIGCYLFMFWTGLRFQDLQRIRPSSISLTDGILRAVCELSKSGQPQPAACIACGFTSYNFSTGWGFSWFDLIQTWLSILKNLSPDFQLDFIFPEVQSEGQLDKALIPRPMMYHKAASILRHVAKQPFMSPPYTTSEVSTLTVHSAKSALISAAKQLDLPTHWIAEQGHHRGKRTQGDRYSRDDTTYQLLLQKTIVCKTRQGWRPLTPQARGGQHPILQRDFNIPTGALAWPSFLQLSPCHEPSSASDLSKAILQISEDKSQPQLFLMNSESSEPKTVPVSDSDSFSESSSSSSDATEQKTLKGPFILNHFTRIAHVIKRKDGEFLPSCGAIFFDKTLYKVSDVIPDDFELYHRKGLCMMIHLTGVLQ